MKNSLIAVLSPLVLLTACGGGSSSDSPATTTATTPATTSVAPTTVVSVPEPDCPANYRTLNMSKSSLFGNSSLTLTADEAGLLVKTPREFSNTQSFKICFGKSPAPLVDGGLYTMSNTYEVIIYPREDTLADFLKKNSLYMSLDFKVKNLPSGTTTTQAKEGIHVYSNTNGGINLVPELNSNFSTDASFGNMTIAVTSSGKFVAAYKP